MAYDQGQVAGYGAAGNARNRIAQALLNVANPPPRSQAPADMVSMGMQQQGAPSPATSNTRPGQMPPVATGVPGVPSMAGMMPGGMPAVPAMSSVPRQSAVFGMTGMPGTPAMAGPGGAGPALPQPPIGQT
jgi:hypothetical protein